MTGEIGWYFPPTGGGEEAGFNDSGIENFSGTPMFSLARETIQNSLDARIEASGPVEMFFDLIEIDRDEIGADELSEAVESCIKHAKEDEDEQDVIDALEDAKKCLSGELIQCLKISDSNTTGLDEKHWKVLVKCNGKSLKEKGGAGGSFGIGKAAPFVLSRVRTVCYWSHYQENGSTQEKFQGKSILMSHTGENGLTQGTGYYGIKEECQAVKDNIPSIFRVVSDNKPVAGTSLAILGFMQTEKWQWHIAASTIANYFMAIEKELLTVNISAIHSDLPGKAISSSNLGDWFKWLSDKYPSNQESIKKMLEKINQAEKFWRLSKKEPIPMSDNDLGQYKLWVETGDDLPCKVALTRQTGMLITTDQEKLTNFPSYQDFVALCYFDNEKGNELLRKMENITHDKFEPDRLKELGHKILNRVTNNIREEIKKLAGPTKGGKQTELTEISHFLPMEDDEPIDEDFSDHNSQDNDGNKNINKPRIVSRPRSRKPYTPPKRNAIEVVMVRVVRIDDTNTYKLRFVPKYTGMAKLTLHESGDSSDNIIDEIKFKHSRNNVVKLKAHKRTCLRFSTDVSIENIALKLSAKKIIKSKAKVK